MSSFFTDQRRLKEAAVDLDTADAELTLGPVVAQTFVSKVRVHLTEANNTADTVVTVGIRASSAAAGADVTTNLGTFTIPTAAAAAADYVVYVAGVDTDPVIDTAGGISQPAEVTTGRVNGYQTNQPGMIELNPGDVFVVQSNGAGGGAAAIVSIEYFEIAKDADTAVPLTFTRS